MPYKVLVVDDSAFFRRRVKEILEQDPELVVIGDARDGEEAVAQCKALKPDVVTMDVEMPVLDGIEAVRRIMSSTPVPILMFSSLTHEGAEATLDALDAGALDFLPKKFEDIARNRADAMSLLQSRVKALGPRKVSYRFSRSRQSGDTPGTTKQTKMFMRSSSALNEATRSTTPTPGTSASGKQYRALAIGTSTGGPVALQTILADFPETFAYPILLVQHMPGTFTSAFAERLNKLCKIRVVEAKDGDVLQAGTAYLAPGGRQMLIETRGANVVVRISDAEGMPNVTYKPSVDLTFSSLARAYNGDILGVILTGMGADGREGCRALKAKGAAIWAQDEKSCVVYGMPQAVTAAGISERSLGLREFASAILMEMHKR